MQDWDSSQDACPQWDWGGWSKNATWNSRDWSSSGWFEGDWGAGNWWSWDQAPKPAPLSEEASRVQALLQRGHTVDRMSEEDLQLVVQEIEGLKRKKQKLSEEKETRPATASPNSATASAAASPKSTSSAPAAASTNNTPDPAKAGTASPNSTSAAPATASPLSTSAAPATASKESEAPKTPTKNSSSKEPNSSGKEKKSPKESKSTRKKRLHARYMRFARSLVSWGLGISLHLSSVHVYMSTRGHCTCTVNICAPRPKHSAGDQEARGKGPPLQPSKILSFRKLDHLGRRLEAIPTSCHVAQQKLQGEARP